MKSGWQDGAWVIRVEKDDDVPREWLIEQIHAMRDHITGKGKRPDLSTERVNAGS